METNKVVTVLEDAFGATLDPARAIGCCRVYVCLNAKTDRKVVTAVAAAAKKLGKIFQRKAYYGLGNALYIGYDACSGREVARGEAVAAALTAAGIVAYSEVCGD